MYLCFHNLFWVIIFYHIDSPLLRKRSVPPNVIISISYRLGLPGNFLKCLTVPFLIPLRAPTITGTVVIFFHFLFPGLWNYFIIIFIISCSSSIFFFESFSRQCWLMVLQRSLSDSNSHQVSGTLLSFLADLDNASVWMVSTCTFVSKFFSPCTNPFLTIPRAPIKCGITVIFMFHCFFWGGGGPFLSRSRYLSLFLLSFSFILWPALTDVSSLTASLRSPRLFKVFWSSVLPVLLEDFKQFKSFYNPCLLDQDTTGCLFFFWGGGASLSNGISAFVCYLMPEPFL